MALDRELHTGPAGTLLGGLAWRPPAGGQLSRRAVADVATLEDASHCVGLAGSMVGPIVGLWHFRPSEDGQRLPRGALSAAALFAQQHGSAHPQAGLVLRLPASQAHGERLYTVVLDGGLPTIDALGSADDMRRLIEGSGAGPLWSNDPQQFPGAAPTGFEDLLQAPAAALRSARLHAVPANPWPVVGAAALACVAGLAYWGWQRHSAAVEQRQMEAIAAAQDPRPRYLAALTAQRPGMSADRLQMVNVVRSLYRLPAFVPGWQLRGVECDALRQACTAQWQRRGGGYDELRAALPQQQLQLGGEQGKNLDTATTTWSISVTRGPIEAALPNPDAAALQGGTLWQAWHTAQAASVDMRPAALWPAVADLPSGWRDARAVRRGDITASGVPAALAVEALQAAPAWVSWESVRLDVGELSGPPARTQLQVSLSGYYYVSTTSENL